MKKAAFTLIELMIVVAIIALFAAIAVPSYMRFLAKSKRAEAYMNLSSLYTAEKLYWMEHGSYSDVLSGSKSVGWKPEGYKGGGKQENFNYTYGFAGGEGSNNFTGKLETSSSHLGGSRADKNGFVAFAAGDITGKGNIDIISVNQDNEITIVQDGLK